MNYNYEDPILGVYYYPRPDWEVAQLERDVAAFADIGLRSIWLFFDPFYDVDNREGLRALLDYAHSVGISVTPVLGQFLQLRDHPDVKIVNADGTTSDDPRFWNMGCFSNPTLLQIATERATGFVRDFGDHPALHRIDGKPLMSFVHEAYFRNSVPEFGGGPMQPSCYCEHCRAGWRDYLAAHDLDTSIEPPVEPSDHVIWQHWLEYHAQIIPDFLHQLIQATNAVHPVWSTHEVNDFYPASWQCVYTGIDWWRINAVVDFGHEDMYPLEFDTRYVCYVYDYAKDIVRSGVGFDGLVTCNGQAFNSWLGYQLPENSMSEQIYSALAHGALGLVWWTQLPEPPRDNNPLRWMMPPTEGKDLRYHMIRQTQPFNAEYLALVKLVEGYQLARARVALLYSWTTMSQELADDHTYDTLLTYMMLVQLGYPVDLLSEAQVAGGILQSREYDALFVMGCGALPASVHNALDAYVDLGGLVITDYAPHLTESFPPAFGQWRNDHRAGVRLYMLPDGTPIPVQLGAGMLNPPADADILAEYDNHQPALFKTRQGKGEVIVAGSYLGWDYSAYPGYYDMGKMFPFHIRQDADLRQFFAGLLDDRGILPPVKSSHPDVEVGLWHTPQRDSFVVFVVNHLQSTETTTVTLPVGSGQWQMRGALTGDGPDLEASPSGEIGFGVELSALQGQAFVITKQA